MLGLVLSGPIDNVIFFKVVALLSLIIPLLFSFRTN
jgi:hypothetical protein